MSERDDYADPGSMPRWVFPLVLGLAACGLLNAGAVVLYFVLPVLLPAFPVD